MTAIISAPELAAAAVGDHPPVLLDIRWRLGGLNLRSEYDAGHIPGAVYIDLDTELAAPAGKGGRHPLPDPADFGAVMRRAGVSGARPVVVYDGGQGWAAARAWWLLRWSGHGNVRVLDGGLPAWLAYGGEVSDSDTGFASGTGSDPVGSVAPGDFVPEPGGLELLDADGAAALARSGLLLDARAAERYRGDVEPIDPVGGHIPGAISAPTTENTDREGRFLPAQSLALRFAALGVTDTAPVGVYCGSGVSGAHQVLALELAGLPAALYAGSWSDWTTDPGRPVATGAQPG